MKAGKRNNTAKHQAIGSPKQMAWNLNNGTAKILTVVLANISETPDNKANRVYPIPWYCISQYKRDTQYNKDTTEILINITALFNDTSF